MQDELLGYVLGVLDPETQRQVQQYLEANPQARLALQRLERALAPLYDDQDQLDPPAGLAHRTITLVASHQVQVQIVDRSPDSPPGPATHA